MNSSESRVTLRRDLGVAGATMMGLGSIMGAGVFVSLGIVAGLAGPSVLLAVFIAALVAVCNGLNSAQLAASHPVSGGAYEYGYTFLRPWLGFTAGTVFLAAKTASAATSALGFAGYLLIAFGADPAWHIPVALVLVATLTIIVLVGIRTSNAVNIAVVSITLLALAVFIFAGLSLALENGAENFTPFFPNDNGGVVNLFTAIALMFVAYTGYGRVATLGEEVREPQRTIPKAIIATLAVTMLVYMAVAAVGVGAAGAENFAGATGQGAAPLEIIARGFQPKGIHLLIALGAMTAMVGVSLNLILGLSRVMLAMGRRGDAPKWLSYINDKGSPTAAVLITGIFIAALVLIGDVRVTWSFSAFTVLIYYAINNLAALALPAEKRLYPRWIAVLGLLACAFLAVWIEPLVIAAGLAAIVVAHMLRTTFRALSIR